MDEFISNVIIMSRVPSHSPLPEMFPSSPRRGRRTVVQELEMIRQVFESGRGNNDLRIRRRNLMFNHFGELSRRVDQQIQILNDEFRTLAQFEGHAFFNISERQNTIIKTIKDLQGMLIGEKLRIALEHLVSDRNDPILHIWKQSLENQLRQFLTITTMTTRIARKQTKRKLKTTRRKKV